MTADRTSSLSLMLDEGSHTVAFTDMLGHHLSLDYLLLVPVQ